MVTKEEVKASIEYKWRGQQWKLYLGIFAFVLVIMVPVGFLEMNSLEMNSLEISGAVFGIVAVIYGLIFGPFVLYYVWRQWELVRRREHYERHQVKLDKPSTSWSYRGAIYYHVRFQDNAGNWVSLDTKPLFSGGMLSSFLLEDYNNQTVDIFYDPEKEQVIVIGLSGKGRDRAW